MTAFIASIFAILSIWEFGRKSPWAWRFALVEMAFWWAFMLGDIQSRWGLAPINICKTVIVVWNLAKPTENVSVLRRMKQILRYAQNDKLGG